MMVAKNASKRCYYIITIRPACLPARLVVSGSHYFRLAPSSSRREEHHDLLFHSAKSDDKTIIVFPFTIGTTSFILFVHGTTVTQCNEPAKYLDIRLKWLISRFDLPCKAANEGGQVGKQQAKAAYCNPQVKTRIYTNLHGKG